MPRVRPLCRLAFQFAAVAAAAAQDRLATESRTMLPIGQQYTQQLRDLPQLADTVVSPDGSHVATLRQELTRFVVTVDGIKSQAWDEVGYFADPDQGSSKRGPALVFSPSGDRVAYVARLGDRSFLVVGADQTPIEPGRLVRAGSFRFAPDGSRYAMVVLDQRQGKAWLVADGVKSGPFGQVAEVLFSASGRRLAYVANKSFLSDAAEGATVYLDGKPVAEYPKVESLQLSRSGDHLAFKAFRPDGWRVIVAGKQMGGRYATVDRLRMSPDGRRTAFIGTPTQDGVNSTGAQAVIDGQPSATYASVTGLALSPDGTRYAFLAMRNIAGAGPRYLCVIDGKESSDFPAAVPEDAISFSPDSKSVAVHMGGTSLLVDGKVHASGGMSAGAVVRVGAVGPALAYKTRGDDNIVRVVVNGVPGPPLAEAYLNDLSFGPDGTWAAYPARDTQSRIVLVAGDRTYPLASASLDVPDSRFPSEKISTSPGSQRVVYAQGGRLYLDGIAGPPCPFRSHVTFTPSGDHLAFACGRGPFTVFVDGMAGPVVNAFFTAQGHSWKFDDDGRLVFTAVVGPEVQRLQVTPPPGAGLAAFGRAAASAGDAPSANSRPATQGSQPVPSAPQGTASPPSQPNPPESVKEKLDKVVRPRLPRFPRPF